MSKKYKRKIVAIGGGELKELETLKIDKEIVKLAGKKHPRALFIPTASGDPKGYCDSFKEVYGKRLGCKVDFLLLLNKDITQKEIREKILGSDLIYVGGGNTYKMLRRWRKLKVDKYLKQAWNKGIVLSGISAGSICWFKYGQSDSPQFTNPDNPKLIKVRALGFIDAFHCPHYLSKKRKNNFDEMVTKGREMGIAINDFCAMVFKDNEFDVIASRNKMYSYRVFKKNNKVVREKIEPKRFEYKINSLLER